ncbi:MAG: ABC transporter substrate-binding protein [Nitrospinota bacterium]|jgi:NitT/TauT family transport system substrate-binding protein|nr:ABC transporter substrate-binding protein [Nitrospinota bacterium]
MKFHGMLLRVGLVLGLAFSAVPARAADKVTFAADWILYGKHAPFVLAIEKGFYKKHNLDVDFSRGFGSADTIKRVGAKTTDFGFADTANLVVARARGTKVKGIAIIAARSLYTIYTLKKNNIRTPKDLKGKLVGGPVRDVARTIFPAFARINGLDPDKDVRWLDMTAAARLSSLLTGRVDAFSGFGTATPTFVAGAKKAGRTIVEIKYADWGLDTYAHSLITHNDTIEAKPDLVKRFVRATLEAWASSMKNPEQAIQAFHRRSPATSLTLARGHLKIAISVLVDGYVRKHGLGAYDPDKIKRTIDVISRFMKLPSVVRPTDLYTNAFLPGITP